MALQAAVLEIRRAQEEKKQTEETVEDHFFLVVFPQPRCRVSFCSGNYAYERRYTKANLITCPTALHIMLIDIYY